MAQETFFDQPNRPHDPEGRIASGPTLAAAADAARAALEAR